MKPEIKKKWLKALTGGEYEQAKGRLRRGDAFCCLGVLCDLYVKEGMGRWKREILHSDYILPGDVVTWAGLQDCDPDLKELLPSKKNAGEEAGTLAGMNDEGYSFKEIAKVIRKQL